MCNNNKKEVVSIRVEGRDIIVNNIPELKSTKSNKDALATASDIKHVLEVLGYEVDS